MGSYGKPVGPLTDAQRAQYPETCGSADYPRSRKGPPSDEERAALRALAARGRTAMDKVDAFFGAGRAA